MGLKDTILNMVPGDAARKVSSAMGGALNGHTTSGMDAAMQAHADEQHPVKPPAYKGPATAPGKIKQWGEP